MKRYIKLSQHLLSTKLASNKLTVSHIESFLESASEYDRECVFQSDTPIPATWGSGVFQVETDGSLTLIDSYWDSSD